VELELAWKAAEGLRKPGSGTRSGRDGLLQTKGARSRMPLKGVETREGRIRSTDRTVEKGGDETLEGIRLIAG
jgi:hypothetical protein